jgi:CBS-domain-containing membrane protein
MVFYLYVVDERRHLVGVVSSAGCCSSRPTRRSSDHDDRRRGARRYGPEEVARQVASYNLLAIPVVDPENKLVGVITATTSSTPTWRATEDAHARRRVEGRWRSRRRRSRCAPFAWLLVNPGQVCRLVGRRLFM